MQVSLSLLTSLLHQWCYTLFHVTPINPSLLLKVFEDKYLFQNAWHERRTICQCDKHPALFCQEVGYASVLRTHLLHELGNDFASTCFCGTENLPVKSQFWLSSVHL